MASRSLELMLEASHDDVAKLQQALIACGVSLGTAALSLIIFKAPGGILLRLHGDAAFYLYYGILAVFATFGFVQASFGYWVLQSDQSGWRATGRNMLWVSIIALVIVAALGGGVFLKL